MIRPRRDARGTETCLRPDTIDPSIVSTSDWPGMPKGRLARAALAYADALVVRWLPGGQREGDEYVVRNPRRIDDKPGSFKINIRTGAWADFVTGEAGGDLVALRAWLDGATQLARSLTSSVSSMRRRRGSETASIRPVTSRRRSSRSLRARRRRRSCTRAWASLRTSPNTATRRVACSA